MDELYTLREIKKPACQRGLCRLEFLFLYLDVTLIFFGRADSAFGSLSVSTPSVIFASTCSASRVEGRRKVRENEPLGSSLSRYLFSSALSIGLLCLYSPSMRTTSSKTWMFKSSALSPDT